LEVFVLKSSSIQKLSASALLIAVGIVIPMVSPLKFVMEPASFTLASHVAVFIAMVISPGVAAAVAVGTTIGFLLGGFPLVIVLRAASHIVFALGGALYLQRSPNTNDSPVALRVFSFVIALVHALCELVVVSAFYFGGNMGESYYQQGFLQSVLLLVGLGTVIHSMVDFEIAHAVVAALQKQKGFAALTHKA